MKHIARIACLITALVPASLFAAPPTGQSMEGRAAIAATPEQYLTGKEAVAHLQKLERQKRLDVAAKRLREQGYTPTENVSVIRSASPVRGRSYSGDDQIQPAQTVADGSGEVTFWEWDDGSDGTWGGVIYVENYMTGASATWDTQLDVRTQTFSVIWEEFVEGTPPSGGYLQTSAPVRGSRTDAPQVASTSPAVAFNAMQVSSDIVLVQSARGVRYWLGCITRGCARSTLCPLNGPGCFLGCGSGVVRCAIENLV